MDAPQQNRQVNRDRSQTDVQVPRGSEQVTSALSRRIPTMLLLLKGHCIECQ